jgi:eukaryotic-like serine/threonine-protein kinase
MTAAALLEGLDLEGGWKVVERLEREPGSTGGMFSQSYKVEKAGKVGFLKAFDFSEAFEPGKDTLEILKILTAAYEHERDVLEHCSGRHLSKVVLALEHGFVQVPKLGTMEGRVYYLIFEMASSDVRCQVDVAKAFDIRWSMRAMKDIALALWQVHREMIAHQDAKPSNILLYEKAGFKLADFGRSSRRERPTLHDNANIAGDRSYAPPELIYGYLDPEFAARRFGCDLYMLGNLAAFLFSGRNITSMLIAQLDAPHKPRNWGGKYQQVLPYLQSAFATVLADLAPLIDARIRDDVICLIAELCNPDITLRGHPKGVGKYNQYSLERYVSRFDVLSRKTDFVSRSRSAA